MGKRKSIRRPAAGGPSGGRAGHGARPLLAILAALAALALLICAPTGAAAADAPVLSAGADMPALSLPRPSTPDQAAYLGLKPGQGPIKLGDIGRPLVLVELFNMYCTHCQAEAPAVNRLDKIIEAGPLKGRLAMIGVGIGNSAFEVKVFRQRYDIGFPLFPYADPKIHEMLGKPRTPTFVLLGMTPGKPPRILLVHVGRIGNLNRFLQVLTRKVESWQQP